MRSLAFLMLAATLIVPASARASDPAPEIEREPAAPQQTGVLHALRTIPEAWARLQGDLSNDPAEPYRFAVVRPSPSCPPRVPLHKDDAATHSSHGHQHLHTLHLLPSAALRPQATRGRNWLL